MPDTPFPAATLADVLDALRRRRGAMALAFGTGLLLALLLAMLLPPRYRAVGTVLIEQQELPVDLVRSTVTSFADQRLQTISQRVMTTQTLAEIIRKYDLYADDRKSDTRDEILEGMRKDISLDLISANVIDPRSGRPQKATIAFTVSYANRSAESAYRVANELTTLYLNENLSNRTKSAQEASLFLTTEGNRIDKEVEALEIQLARFKEKNADALPELVSLNTQGLDRVEQDLRQSEARLASLDQQKVFLEAQLALASPNGVIFAETGERILSAADRLKVAKSQLAVAVGTYGEEHPDVQRLRRQIAALESDVGPALADGSNDRSRRLEEAQSELAASRERYSAEHPDIQRLERVIAQLEAESSGAPAKAAAKGPVVAERADNPAYVQLRTQLAATGYDRDALVAEIVQIRRRIGDYERALAASPQVERSYRELVRNLQNGQLKYQELRAKQMEAKVSENLETDRKGERFTLIDPPMPPERPESPNRGLILVLGTFLSLLLAAGVAALLESLDSTIRGTRDLRTLMRPVPLTIVPTIWTDGERLVMSRRRRLTVAGAFAGCVLAALAVHLMVRPLDMLWFSAMRRFGA